MNWLTSINLTEGEWYQCVVLAEDDKTAIEIAYDHATAEEMEVDNITAELFEQCIHGDIADYEILN